MTEPRRESISADELRIWRNYIETAELLRARLERRLQSDSSLSSGDYGVLLALSEADQHTLRSSDLAAVVGWERSRLSHHLGRMEKRELICRSPSAEDTRGSEIRLTEMGATAFRRGSVPHLRAVQDLFLEALTPEQLVGVESMTDSLRAYLEPET
ncbi:MarR family transcriptional regulator [Subtercola boreus]|uniref:MarR family transcriptional regulator n=1 Tax=Subtercola boreus TaxID=120213 RepID=A0A3E0VVX5_9MICO|nr:MarR family winged helix-turn-helix transcriptional regulator [Subtercola boreus]RFA14016.1 MarR family transcriptional regulator [Subtercola boreus]